MKTFQPQFQKNVPRVVADPDPDMPTIEEDSNKANCNVEMAILQNIHENNLEELKALKIHLRDLNYLEEYTDDFIDVQIHPLALAASTGSVEVVKLLLSNEGIDVNFETQPQGLTALKIACSYGFYEIAEMLVQQGANVNQTNKQGTVPLFYCFSRLEEESNTFENKFLCFKLAELLIDNGANIDAIVFQDKQYTLLMMFCALKEKLNDRDLQVNLDVIRFLLQNGADRFRVTKKGKKLADLIKKHPAREEVLKLLNEVKAKNESQPLSSRRGPAKPPIIQKQVVKMEGKPSSSNNCCCTLLTSSRRKKEWWQFF